MFSRTQFHHRQFTFARLIAACALLFIVALAVAVTQRSHAAGKRQSLSFEDRVAAQRAIEEVYHRHRIWPADNPQPKPSIEALLGADALRDQSAKVVEDALRLSTALAAYWQRPLTAADLQAEVERMARDTRQPDLLRELWAALRDDPLLVAEAQQKEPQLDLQLSQRLWHAARRGDLTVLTSLLDKSADVNAKNAMGITALMMATANGHAEVVSALLARGANINARDDDGRTALLLAAFYNHNDILQTLLADRNTDGLSPLEISRRGFVLTPAGGARNKDGMSPLMVATFMANLTAVKALIAKGADPQAKENEGLTVLMWAVIGGDVKIIETILAQKVDVNAKSTAGITALSLAKFKNSPQIQQLLAYSGAKEEGVVDGMNPVSQAVVSIVNTTIALGAMEKVTKTILERKEQVGLNQLIDETTAQDVLDGSLDINAKDKDGSPLLTRAVVHGQLATVKTLLSKGVDPNTRSANGVPALMWAITRQALDQKNDIAITTALLEGGADVNAKSQDGGTPLMLAVAAGKIDLVRTLLAKGADVNAKAQDGTTAIKLAEKLAKQDAEMSRRSRGRISGGSGREMVILIKEAQKKQKR